MKYVQPIMIETLSDVWEGFIQRVPFIVGALFVLLITWLVSMALDELVRERVHNVTDRESHAQLVERLTKTAVWVIGVVAAAMIVFPRLTPAKALGAASLASLAVSRIKKTLDDAGIEIPFSYRGLTFEGPRETIRQEKQRQQKSSESRQLACTA